MFAGFKLSKSGLITISSILSQAEVKDDIRQEVMAFLNPLHMEIYFAYRPFCDAIYEYKKTNNSQVDMGEDEDLDLDLGKSSSISM